MKTVFNFILGIIIVVVITGGLLFYLGQDLKEVSMERFDLRGIENVDSDSFTLNGNFYVKNPSSIPVPVKVVDYDVYLKETGEKIGSGTIPGFTLDFQQVNEVGFHQEIRWIPTVQLATDFLTEDEVLVEVKGHMQIDLPEIEKKEIPFSDETDIKEYIVQFAIGPAGDNVNNLI